MAEQLVFFLVFFSQILKHMFTEALGLEPNKFPLAFIHLQVLPRLVDVNLEPNKTRVFLHRMVGCIFHSTSSFTMIQ